MELLIAKILFYAPWIMMYGIGIMAVVTIVDCMIIDPVIEKSKKRKEDKEYLDEMKRLIKEREA